MVAMRRAREMEYGTEVERDASDAVGEKTVKTGKRVALWMCRKCSDSDSVWQVMPAGKSRLFTVLLSTPAKQPKAGTMKVRCVRFCC